MAVGLAPIGLHFDGAPAPAPTPRSAPTPTPTPLPAPGGALESALGDRDLGEL